MPAENLISAIGKFFNVRQVPALFWSAPHPLSLRPPVLSVVMLCIGLALFGFGEALIIAAGLGVSPWTVLAQGLAVQTGWSIGLSTFIVSLFILILWMPLRQTPGIGTILNAIIISVMIDISLPLLYRPDHLFWQFVMLFCGIMTIGLGSALYLVANLGPGARDGLMTGLQRRLGWPIMYIRSSIEMTAVLIGWSLGGIAGIGTVIFAFGVGSAVSAGLHSMVLITSHRNG